MYPINQLAHDGADLDELLNYGTDAECKVRLESLASALHELRINSIEDIEKLQSEVEELEKENDSLRFEMEGGA